MEIIRITPEDDRYTIRTALHHAMDPHVVFVLPWDVEKGWDHPLDYEILFREAQSRGMQVAWVVDDIARRPVIRAVGFPLFGTAEAAESHLAEKGSFPPLRAPQMPERPRKSWWAEESTRPKPPVLERQPTWLIALEMGVAVVVILVLISAVLISLPSAHIVLVPEGVTYARVIPVSVDPALETVDLQRSVIPSRRIGDEFESFVEIGTSGRGFSFSGRAQGQVLFTNLLGQDYRVPAGTVVRTTSGSYPVRFATTQEVIIPAFGQAPAPVRALEEGPSGNVDPYQINLVEGVVGFAVRVTNPNATGGAESTTVAVVAEADRERAWDLAAQQVMAEAYNGLQDPAYLEPGEFLPHQALVIQATPKQAYTHLVGEETATLGLSLRLLVTGQVVSVGDAQAVAFRQLALQLPEGYELIDARFQYGEAAEEDVGPGLFTFYVTAEGYAAAKVDGQTAFDLVKGKSAEDATKVLMETMPLARPPDITVKPDWFPLIPLLPIRTTIEVIPADWQG